MDNEIAWLSLCDKAESNLNADEGEEETSSAFNGPTEVYIGTVRVADKQSG